MLVCAHERRHPVGEREAQTVGADLPLRVGESRREVDVVECLQQAAVARQPGEDDALGVGEHHADRLAGQRPVQVGEHFVAALEE